MAEVDYQMALLLEYKFEQEKSCLSDLQLAKSLQEQYEKEYAVERPVQNLVYEKINQNSSKNPTKSLTDPSWEVIDPTPDIHNLFMAFNERFFWNKLLAVCVSWSKRMTSCAGICSYDGRGGMCRITLSEPLLKLRPRKDLVETLLHEMIHAYLFVTHNNRDRDGHGPEFHKHMYRINAESGTNITVYHNFFDEVRLYKQHWWRCNGPCQKWKPFFGMVRRAMNRPPGPNDKWWGKHSMDCGGSFIKVKEPEKNVKTVSTAKSGSDKTKQDIRNFIPLVGKKSADTSANNTPTTSNDNTKISNVIPKSNIFGFNDLNGSTKATKTNSSGNGFKGSIRNNSSTVIINKKPSSSTKDVETINSKQTDPPPSTSQPPKVRSHDDYSVVRNHWTNKFPVKSATKRSFDDTDSTRIPSEKLPKLSQPTIECPICSKKISEEHLNSHIDDCLLEDNPRVCIICEKNIPLRDYQDHVNKCSEEIFKDDVFVEATENVPECWKKTKKKKKFER
nr:sprT-like domain-containing protein Spartan [Leptinotarsa decemlineata]